MDVIIQYAGQDSLGRLDSVEWNGGMEWWNGIVEWNSGMTVPLERALPDQYLIMDLRRVD